MKRAIILGMAILAFACESHPPQETAKKPGPKSEVGKAENVPVMPRLGDTVRKMYAAGRFYPGDKKELREMVENYIAGAGDVKKVENPIAIITPHAGYVFSGPVAGCSYAAVKGLSYDTVVLIGGHSRSGEASVLDADFYQTPLGYVEIDREITEKLLAKPGFNYSPQRHAEHALEVQVPFLQIALSGRFKLVAIAVNNPDAKFAMETAGKLAEVLRGKKVLIVASTDLSHYPPYDDAKAIDLETMEAWKTLDGAYILKRDAELMKEHAGVANLQCAACGPTAVAIALETAKLLGADSIELLKYANSGDVPAGDKKSVVGYGAAVIYEQGKKMREEISKESQAYLLKVAREAIAGALAGKRDLTFKPINEELKAKRGVFVTLNKKGALRGCIGCFSSEKDLPSTVAEYAVYSALHDSRFPQVTEDELPEIRIKISILSKPRKVDSPEEVVVGRDGIWVRDTKTGRGGTYLPEVATDLGWDRETFLTDCCLHKAGLPGDAWKEGASFMVFEAEVFSEKKE